MNYLGELIRVDLRNRMEISPHYVFVEVVHTAPREWRTQCSHLVDNTPQRPHIGFLVVGPILPNLRTGVIRSPCLSANKSIFIDLRNIHIADLVISSWNKYIFTLQVSVQDGVIMKYFQAMKKMDKYFPYLKLGDEFFVLFSCIDGLAEVALVCQLHHDT